MIKHLLRSPYKYSLICILLILFTQLGCSRNGYDSTKITHRPRIFVEGGAPIPIIDEYDISGTKLGSFSDIFSPNKEGRIYGIWIGLDRRAAMTLQKETANRIGGNLKPCRKRDCSWHTPNRIHHNKWIYPIHVCPP